MIGGELLDWHDILDFCCCKFGRWSRAGNRKHVQGFYFSQIIILYNAPVFQKESQNNEQQSSPVLWCVCVCMHTYLYAYIYIYTLPHVFPSGTFMYCDGLLFRIGLLSTVFEAGLSFL